MMLTREQRRAQDAHRRVTARHGRPDHEKYGAMAHRLPPLIRSAGLALALEFVESRGEGAHRDLLDDLAGTLGFQGRGGLREASRGSALLEYMRLTREALAVCTWYRRFAESVLGVQTADDAGGGSDEVVGI